MSRLIWGNDSISDFRVARARVIVLAKDQEGAHEDDVAYRRIRGGARMRHSRMWHWRASARLSIASHHDDRAVPGGRPHPYARANSWRRNAGLDKTAYRPPASVPEARRTCAGFISKTRPTPGSNSYPIAAGRLRCRT